MTKMDMIWVAVASALHQSVKSSIIEKDIHSLVWKLFQAELTPAMINTHLVSSTDRQADKNNPQRGGSRNRYLFKESNGNFRLYKKTDATYDGWDKTGPCCPSIDKLPYEYQDLVTWYENEYAVESAE